MSVKGGCLNKLQSLCSKEHCTNVKEHEKAPHVSVGKDFQITLKWER